MAATFYGLVTDGGTGVVDAGVDWTGSQGSPNGHVDSLTGGIYFKMMPAGTYQIKATKGAKSYTEPTSYYTDGTYNVNFPIV